MSQMRARTIAPVRALNSATSSAAPPMPSAGARVSSEFWRLITRPRIASGIRSTMSTPIRLPNRPLPSPTRAAAPSTIHGLASVAIALKPTIMISNPVRNQVRRRPRRPAAAYVPPPISSPTASELSTSPSSSGRCCRVKYTGRTSAWKPARTTTTPALIRVVASRNGERRRVCQPSRSTTRCGAAPSAGITAAGTTPASRGMSNVTAAAEAEVAAVTHSTATPSNAAISTAPVAGPISMTIAPSASRSPSNRSALVRPVRMTPGIIASRAVSPGTSPNEPITANSTNQPSASPTVASTKGSAAIESAEITSVSTAAVRRLIRSITTPMTSPATAAGSAEATATAPVASTLPVVCRTSNGRTTPAMELPSMDRT